MSDNPFARSLWFDPQSLRALTDEGTWSRGLMLYRNQKVLEMDIGPIEGEWLIEGTVQGSLRQPYELTIDVTLSPQGKVTNWDSYCDCPVEFQCKHGIALMVKAAYQGMHTIERTLGEQGLRDALAAKAPTAEQIEAARLAAQARRDELARQEAEAHLLQWLQDLDRAQGRRAPELVSTASTTRHELYVYLLKVVDSAGPQPQLQMEAATSYRKADGAWAKPKAIRAQPHPGQAIYDQAGAADHEVLQLLQSMPNNHRYYSAYSASPSAVLSGRVGVIALQTAAATGRLYLNSGAGTPDVALRWGPARGLTWQWQEVPSLQGGTEPGWVLRAALATAEGVSTASRLCLNTPPLYLDAQAGLCGTVEANDMPPEQLSVLLKTPALKPSALKKHQLELTQRLGSIPLPPVLEALTRLEGVTPLARLHLAPHPTAMARYRGLIRAQLQFDYQGYSGWWAGQGTTVMAENAQGRVLLQRDAEAELDAITRLLDLGLMSTEGGEFGIPGNESQQPWLHWADDDYRVLRDGDFVVTLDAALTDWITHADALAVQMQPHGGAQDDDATATSAWFDLSLGMEINGERHNILPWLPELIAAAASSPLDATTGEPDISPFVYLAAPSGVGFVRVPTESLRPWMAALLELVGDRAHNFSGDSLKLSRMDALRTSAALGEGAVWDGAAALQATVQQLRGHAELPMVPVPASLQAQMRPYQQQGLNWLQFLGHNSLCGILADDMGLGKTLQTLAHILVEKEAGRLTRPALIVAPVSLMGNWRREAERFSPTLRVLVLHGKDRHDAAAEMASHDVVVAPYSLLPRDRERWLQQAWHLVVLDEAQNIKNANTHAAQVVGELNTRHRLCLSGTPMENHLGELWSLFHFLMPGFLGSQQRFKDLFRNPIEKLGDGERLDQLRRRITPFMLRRTKREVATELPDKIESISSIELQGKQADLYETVRLSTEKAVREALNAKGLAKSQIHILDALLKLRQVCCDPRLLALASAKKIRQSAKLEHLMEILPEMIAEGRRVLLFSQFTSMLALIEDELKVRDIPWVKLTGQSQKRDELIDRFTSGEVPLFLISLKAGGVGLNLPQADTVIHYDPWWNPAVENQATDRAHRIGQTHQVFVYKLVAQGTIEERILALQERKAALAESMYSGSQGRKQPLFSESDVAELLKPLG